MLDLEFATPCTYYNNSTFTIFIMQKYLFKSEYQLMGFLFTTYAFCLCYNMALCIILSTLYDSIWNSTIGNILQKNNFDCNAAAHCRMLTFWWQFSSRLHFFHSVFMLMWHLARIMSNVITNYSVFGWSCVSPLYSSASSMSCSNDKSFPFIIAPLHTFFLTHLFIKGISLFSLF